MFKINKITINTETVGQKLSQARKNKRIELAAVAGYLKINIKYLEALENGQLKMLPAGVYAQNYLQVYADYLGLDTKEIMTQHKIENEGLIAKKDKKLFAQKVTKARYFLSLPKLLKNFLILAVIAVCVVYIGLYINNIISAPELIINSPANDMNTTERRIEIKGKADKNASVNINGEEILTDQNGEISYILDLKEGINTVVVQAQKKYSKKRVVIRNILVN